MNAKQTVKLLSQTLLLLLASFSVGAAPLTPDQALRRAETSPSVRRMPGNQRYMLEYTEKAAGENILYVFNKGDNGFIIASADDRMPALLGYSDSGSFDLKNASPEFKWWLSQYAAEVDGFLKSDQSRNYAYSASRSNKEAIPKLLSTQWNQGYPFNLACPEDAGGRCVTGCVATAMAQVIKYYDYPSVGTGSHSYSWGGGTLGFNYADAVFDYANMHDVYYDNTPQHQIEAVANLMFACGVSVDMDYSSRESGASAVSVMRALKEYFNYDSNMSYLSRDCFSNDEWNDIVYSELKENRPVMYRGASENGGHMFVCDGYEDDFFHINWGWGGYCDGWFRLSALNPDGQGIGGFEGGYNLQQGIICGVQPYSDSPLTAYPIYATSGFEVTGFSNSYVELSFIDYGGVYNYSPNEINTSFYLKAVAADGTEYLSQGVDLNFKGTELFEWGFWGIPLYLPQLGEGEYKAYVVFDGPQGQLQQLSIPLSYKDYLNMKVDAEGNVSFYNDADVRPVITVTQLSPLTEIMTRKSADFNISIINSSELAYSGSVYIRCCVPGTAEVVSEQSLKVSVRGGETFSETCNMSFDIQPGNYELRCYDMFGNSCSQPFPITVVENPEVVKIVVNEIKAVTQFLSGQPVDVFISVKNEGTVTYEDIVFLKTYNPGSDTSIYQYNLWVSIEPGETFNGVYELQYDLPDGEYDFRCFDASGDQCSDTFTLTIGEGSELPELSVTDMTSDSDVYVGEPAYFYLSYENNSNVAYSGELYVLTFAQGSDEPVSEHGFDVYFEAGASSGIWVELDFDLPAGEYEMICFDMFGNQCSEIFPLTIKEKPEVRVTELAQNSDVISGQVAYFSFTIENTGSVNYNGPVVISTYNHGTDEVVYETGMFLNFEPQEVLHRNIGMSFDLPDGEYDMRCFDMFDEPCSDVFPLIIGKHSIYATSISINETTIEVEVGTTVKLEATVLPDDTTDKTVVWSSSDESIATVDQDGNVTVIAVGLAVITAETTDGSDLSAECTISAVSSVSAIFVKSGKVDIYTSDGMLIKKNVDSENIDNLQNGTYIIRTPNEVIKMIKR